MTVSFGTKNIYFASFSTLAVTERKAGCREVNGFAGCIRTGTEKVGVFAMRQERTTAEVRRPSKAVEETGHSRTGLEARRSRHRHRPLPAYRPPRRGVCQAAQETDADEPLQRAAHLAGAGPPEARRSRLCRLPLGPGHLGRGVVGEVVGVELETGRKVGPVGWASPTASV